MAYRHVRSLRSRLQRRTLLSATLASFLGLLSPSANAQLSWDGDITAGLNGGTGIWDASTALTWWDGSTNVAWNDVSNLTLAATFGNTAGIVTVTGAVTANSLTFNTTGYTLDGTGPLTLGGAASIAVTNPAHIATINTILDGAAGLTYTGLGELVLGGNNATLTGAINVNSGILSIAADNNLGAVANGILIDNGTLRSNASFTSGRTFTLGAAGGSLDVTGTNNLTISSVFDNGGANALTKTGTGTVTLSTTTANTRTGVTNINGGKLALTGLVTGVPSGLGTGAVNVAGATSIFEINTGAATSTAQAINLSNGGTFQWTQNAVLTLGAGATINVGTGGGTVSVGGSGATGKVNAVAANMITVASGATLSKTGGGVLQLGQANSGWLGDAAISAGTIEFQNADSMGTAARTVTITGTGDLATSGIANRNNIVLAGGILSANNPAANYTGTVTAQAATTSTIALRQFQATGTANSFTISGALNGTGILNVTAPAAATLTLSGNNSAFPGTLNIGTNATINFGARTQYGTQGVGLNGGTANIRFANSTLASAGTAGLNATYYNFPNNPGTGANNFAVDQLYLSPRTFSRNDANINLPNSGTGNTPIVPVPGYTMGVGNAGLGQRDGVMWKGLINITNAGSYQFSGTNDDNLVLIIDGVQVGTLGVTATNANIGTPVTLSAGAHSIVVKQTQGGGGGYSTLSYNGGAGSDAPATTLIPASAFTNGSLAATDIGPVSVAGGTLDITSPSISASATLGNGTFTLTSPTIDNLTVTGASTINAATPTLAPTTGGLIFAGGIGEDTAGRALNIAGPYFTEFQGTNSYSGLTTVSGGQLRLNAAAGNSIAGNLTINAPNASGAVVNVRVQQNNQLADTATLTMTAGIMDVGTFNDTIGSLTVNGGAILGSGGVLTVANAPTLTSGFIGAGLGGSYNLVKGGTGTVTLAGSGTYTGVTNVNGGILIARAANALGAGGAGNETQVASGAVLQFIGSNNGAENVTLSGTGVADFTPNGAIRNLGGISQVNNLTTGAAATVGVDAGQFIVNGALDVTAGALTKRGVGVLTFSGNQATVPAITLTGGALGFSGPQSFGTATVPAGLAYQFDSNPGAGVTAVTVGPTSAIIGNYAVDNAFIAKIDPASTGALLLGADNSNALNLTSANVALGAKGLVNYTGTLTPNAAGYKFGGLAGQGYGLNELTVSSVLNGTNSLSIAGGTMTLNAENTQSGTVSVTGNGQLRIVNSTNLGAVGNGITLDGGTLQVVSNTNNTNAQAFGQLGNPFGVNGAARVVTIGAGGGTIEVAAAQQNGNSYAFTGTNSLAGSGTMTKSGLGFLFVMNPQTSFTGGITIAPNGGTLDVRSNGSLTGLTGSITIGQSGLLNVDAQNGLGSRQFPGNVAVADRVANGAALNLAGGGVTYTSRTATLSSAETFGVVNLGVGQSAINANSNTGGNSSSIVTFGGLTRVPGSTIRIGGSTGTLGAAAAPTANNTNFIITGQANAAILPYASQFGTNFVAYGANGIVNPTLTAATAPAQFIAANIADQTGDVTLTAGNFEVNALRQSGGATRNLLFTNQTDTLFITSGGYISDGNNNARNIGAGGAAVATNTQGQITAGPLSANALPRELFLHNNANTLTVNSKIVNNNGQAVTVTKDLDGTVTLRPNVNMTATWTSGTNVITVADTSILRVGQPVIGIGNVAFVGEILSPTTFAGNGAPNNSGTAANVNIGVPNTFTGGAFITRGTVNSAAMGSLGTSPAGGATTSMVTVKNATLNLNNRSGVDGTVAGGYSGPIYTVMDQGAINMNVDSGSAASQWNAATDRFSIGTGSTISNLANSARAANRGLNSLTRVATETSFTGGGQIYLAPGAIVRHQLTDAADQGTGALTIQNIGTNADLFFAPGNYGGIRQTVTVGAGTPWAGLSSDRNGLTWNSGTIFANSDFTLQGLTRDGGIATLTLGVNNGADNNQGGVSIVNNSNAPIRASVVGNVIINEDEPVLQPSNLTYVLTPGSLFQPNTSMAMGFGASQASILIQAGGTLDPGNFVALGATANTTRNPDGSLNGSQNLPYALPSPVNGQLTVEAGGRFLINDASGIGSAPIGAWTMKSNSILDLGSANAFYGRGAYGLTQTGTPDTTGVIQNGQFVYENGVVVRIQADNIYKLSQFMPSSSQAPVIEIFNGNRTLTSQNNPFMIPVVGTPTIAPETITLGSGAVLTNDAIDRGVNEGRGKLVLQNGAIIAATSQTFLNVQEGVEVPASATINVGSSSFINGMSKNGLVQFTGPQSNVFGAGAKLVVADGGAFGLNAQNTFPDTTPIELPAAVTNVAPTGAVGFNPGNGSTLLSNTGNFAEIVGHVTGDGSVLGNAAGSFLGINATSNFTSNIRFRTGNTGQQANFWKVGSGVMTVTGVSDSTGQLWVGAGELIYSGAGNSAFGENRVQKGGTLTLDNAGTPLSNRLGGITKSVAPMGGTLNLIGNASTSVQEQLSSFFNSASGQGPFLGATGTTTIKVTPGTAETTLLVNSAENFQSAGIGNQRSGVYIINTPTAANAPITYVAGGGIAGGIVPGVAANNNGLVQIANPNFTVGGSNANAFGIQTGGVYGSAGTPVAATRGDYLGDANNDGVPEGFMTQDGVFLTVTNTSGTAILTGLNTTGLLPGMLVQSGNVPAGTRILSVTPTQVTLTANTTAANGNYQFISGGMRNLVTSEYTATLRDNFIGGLNMRLAGTTSAFGNTGVSSLTMTPGSTLNIAGNLPNGTSSSLVNIAGGGIFVQSGGTATINGSPYGTSRAFLRSSGGASLFLHAQGDLNVNAAVFTDNAIVKTGPGTVTFGDRAFDAFRGSLQIDAGTVTLGTNNTMSNIRSQNGSTSNGNLYINGGTLNLGGNSQMINVLANNNELPGMGGTITSAAPATLTVTGGGRFSGTIGGAISIDKNANNTLLLTNNNTYTGTTLVRAGTLSLRDSGAISGTSAVDVRFGTLQYDNSYLSNVTNRIAPTVPLTLRGATVNITGAAGQVASQTHNLVTLAGGRNDFTSNAGGSGANEMNIGNLVRATNSGAVVSFNQNYGFLGAAGNTTAIRNFITNVNGSSLALTNNILPSWIIANGDHFATYNATTGLSFLSNTADGYATYESTDITTAAATNNVNDGANRNLTASKTVNAWRIAPNAANAVTFNSDVKLTLASGGLITNNNNTFGLNPTLNTVATTATSRGLTSGTSELAVWVNQNTSGINVPVTDGAGSVDFVKSGAGTLNLNPSYQFNNGTANSTTSGSNTVTLTSTTGLAIGMPIGGTGIPVGATITGITSATQITISSNANATGANTVFIGTGNSYTGKTYVNSGTLNLNMFSANGTSLVTVPGDLDIQNATVTELNVGNQIKSTANVTIGGGGRLNLVNLGGVTETLNSITFLDGAGTNGTTNGLDRTATQLTSTINLAAPTAITSTNTNPSTGVPFIGGATGNIAFTNVGGSTLNINSPVAVNGVLAVGLRISSRIGSVPTLAEGGLIKSGTGLLTLDPDQNPVVATTGTTVVGSPVITGVSSTGAMAPGMQVSGTNIPAGSYIISVDSGTQITISANATVAGAVGNITAQPVNFTGALTSAQDVLNIQSGVVRADRHGALGSPYATTTVQNGAVLLGSNNANQVITGSVTLKPGATLGATIQAFTLGAATDVAANQTVLSVPSGNVNIAAYDYFIPATNNANITVNGRLTGAGTINLVGPQLTQGNGGGGVFQLGNPIVAGPGSNDFSGTFNVGTNAILQNQIALIAKNTGITRTTGSALGTATINLAGGRLRLRDDASATADVNNTAVTYGNNVNLTADSFLDANRQTSGSATGNIINLGTLNVSGTRVLTVDSGNTYQVGFTSLDGTGSLIKGGNGRLNINSIAGTYTGGLTIAGPVGITVAPSVSTDGSGIALPAITNLPTFAVSGIYTTETSKTLNIAGTFSVNSNVGSVSDVARGLSNNDGRVAVTNTTTLTAATFQNNGAVGPLGGAATITATAFTGNGQYVTTSTDLGAITSQPLTLAGNVTGGNLRTAGLNTVTVTGTAHNLGTAAQIQSGTLKLAPTANATTSGTITVFGVPAVPASPTDSPIAAVNGVLDFSAPAANTITHTGNIENSGLVRASTGSAVVNGIINGSAGLRYTPGLMEGLVMGTTGFTVDNTRPANPGNFGVQREPRMLQTNVVTGQGLTGHLNDDVWVYNGYVKDDDGVFSFAGNQDDNLGVWINGVLVLNSGGNVVGSTALKETQGGTGVVTANGNGGTPSQNFGPGITLPGYSGQWYEVEIRMRNGTGGAGPWTGAGFNTNYGFGYKNGIGALDGNDYIKPIDDGTGNLFVTAVGSKGNITVQSAASLSAGGFTQIANTVFGDITQGGGTSTFNVTANATPISGITGGNDTDTLSVVTPTSTANIANFNLANGTQAVVNTSTTVDAGQTLNIGVSGASGGRLVLPATSSLALNGSLNVTGVGSTGPTVFVNATTSSGTGATTVANGGILGGTGSLPTGGTLNIVTGGILSPGNSIESLSSGNLTMSSGSTFVFEALNNTATGADLMKVGTLSLTDVTLDLTAANLGAGTWTTGDKLTLINYTGTPITSGFNGYLDDTGYLFGSNLWTINYDDTTGGANYNSEATGANFVTLTAAVIPEPSTLVLGGLALLGLAGAGLRRRRMNQQA